MTRKYYFDADTSTLTAVVRPSQARRRRRQIAVARFLRLALIAAAIAASAVWFDLASDAADDNDATQKAGVAP